MSKYTFNVNKYCIEKDEQFFAYVNTIGANRIVKLLNKQEERIEILKTIREEQTETIIKQKRKIKELEEKNQRLIKMLDNVANYMQKQHKDMPIDDFVEWWNDIATEGL